MSDYPERINISPVHRQKREDDFYLVDRAAFPGKGVEYTRTDHVQTLIAAEREALADHVSANCFSLPSGDASRSYNAGVRDAIDAIRTRTFANAQAALAARDKRLSDRRARDKQIRDEALREAAETYRAGSCSGEGWDFFHEAHDAILALIDADDSGEGE